MRTFCRFGAIALSVAVGTLPLSVWAGPPAGSETDTNTASPAPDVGAPAPEPPATPEPAPLPDWSSYVGTPLKFVFDHDTSFVGTLERDDGETVLVTGTDGGTYSVTKRMVVRLEYLPQPPPQPPPGPAPAPAPVPAPPPTDAQYQDAVAFKEAVRHELSRGESSSEYKQARGMLIGGAVVTGVGSLLVLSGFTAAATGDLADTVTGTDDGPSLRTTGLALVGAGAISLGVGIPLLVIGAKRKRAVTARVKQQLSLAPSLGPDGGGLSLGMRF